MRDKLLKNNRPSFIILIFFIISPLAGQDFNQAYRLFEQGSNAYNNGEYESAIELLNQSEVIFSQLSGSQNLTAYSSLWRGLAQYYLFRFMEAEADFNLAIDEAIKQGFNDIIVTAYIYLAHCAHSADNWAEANDKYHIALSYAIKYRLSAYFPGIYEGLGNVQYGWGKYDDAEQYYTLAMQYAEQQNAEQNIISLLIAFGKIHHAREEYNSAIEQYEEILQRPNIAESIFYASIFNSLGMANFKLLNNELALRYYQQAMEIAKKQNNIVEIIRLHIHIGGIYHQLEKYTEAIDQYFTALPLTEEYQREGDRSVCLYNIGVAYVYLEEYLKAIPSFEQSIEIKERLRLSATGQDRLDYLASEIHVYQWLSLTYLDMEDFESAIDVHEFSSAKYLEEQLLANSPQQLYFSGAKNVQQNLSAKELIVKYGSNSTPWNTLLTISDIGFSGDFVLPYLIIEHVPENFLIEYSQLNGDHRGLTVVGSEPPVVNLEEMSFDDLISYYRLLLYSRSNEEQLYTLGRLLYNYLLAPITEQLSYSDVITIIPDGILAFLPFETLIMPDGRYVIEEYDISYVQSLAVSEIVKSRNYSNSRSEFLGFGGAEYSEFDPENFPEEYQMVRNLMWNDLPGTILELQGIDDLFINGNIYLENEVSETTVKSLSNSGELSNYKIIHFATHGLVLPEQPNLSALVLTDSGREDGYLTAAEIAQLDINADFVNLSACETGLGKIYGGEGVVGLAQSFLIAGANSLSVSLWQVSDISTQEFMTGFYELVVNEGYTYKEAMSEMKRQFIQSEEYSHPYYWAPFIFYGE